MPELSKKKIRGCVYTPEYPVREILDFGGYFGEEILSKHVMDNSCGDGAFLKEVVRIYCTEFLKRSRDTVRLKRELETFVHGVEIEESAVELCVQNLDDEALRFGLIGIAWDIRHADALSMGDYDGRMHFVFGNPPYVRVHNLGNTYASVRRFSCGRSGMTDLFIVFFEVGLRMLTRHGKMALITPSSWLTSNAGTVLREHIVRERNLFAVVDLEHFQAFSATTYSLISLFVQGKRATSVDYFKFDSASKRRVFVENLNYEDFRLGKGFYFSESSSLQKVKSVRNSCLDAGAPVKNGFATLADSVFIGDFDFCEGTIDVVKASTGEWKKCIFPYDDCGNALSPERIAEKKAAFAVLVENKARLLNGRDVKDPAVWYLFGRTQALHDVCKNKIAVSSIIREKESLKLNRVPAGKGVYGGLYILTDLDISVFEKILRSDEFFDYVKILKNYKSGRYYTFSSKDLSLFINFKLKDFYHEQFGVSQSCFALV